MAEHEHHYITTTTSRGRHDICGHPCSLCRQRIAHDEETVAIRLMGQSPDGRLSGGWHLGCARIVVENVGGALAGDAP